MNKKKGVKVRQKTINNCKHHKNRSLTNVIFLLNQIYAQQNDD